VENSVESVKTGGQNGARSSPKTKCGGETGVLRVKYLRSAKEIFHIALYK
jgi:hypothetical protein